jgi:integrase
MDSQRAPTGALVITVGKEGQPHWEGKWRWQGKQFKRRLGRAWLEPSNGYGGKRRATRFEGWIRRAGSVPDGFLDEHAATQAMRAKIRAEIEREQTRAEERGIVPFEDVAREWLREGRSIRGWKPSTIRDYASLLNDEYDKPKKRGARPRARLMKRFRWEPIETISESDIRSFLRELDRTEGISPRSVNKHRFVLGAIFSHAIEHGYRQDNPIDGTSKRRESDRPELIVYSPEQVMAIAHETEQEQDLALIVVAAFSGLRLGELLALRWRDIRWSESAITVSGSYTQGIGTTSTKSRKARSVPLADQVGAVLAKLSERKEFVGQSDLVFVNENGFHVDPTTIRKRYRKALARAQKTDREIPSLRFHDLRHTFGSLLARSGVPVLDIQTYLGHANLRTTQIYLHHAPQKEAAARITAAFASESVEAVEEEPEVA